MRKSIIINLLITIFSSVFLSCKSQPTKEVKKNIREEKLENHVEIVPDKKSIIVPMPPDSTLFINSFKEILIAPKSVFLDEDGDSLSYQITLDFRVDTLGKVIYLNDRHPILAIRNIVINIKKVIYNTKWKGFTKETIRFSCIIHSDRINEICISSKDNYKRECF